MSNMIALNTRLIKWLSMIMIKSRNQTLLIMQRYQRINKKRWCQVENTWGACDYT